MPPSMLYQKMIAMIRDSDVLFVIMCCIYLKLIVEFMASLAPEKKQRKRSGKWSEDETKGH